MSLCLAGRVSGWLSRLTDRLLSLSHTVYLYNCLSLSLSLSVSMGVFLVDLFDLGTENCLLVSLFQTLCVPVYLFVFLVCLYVTLSVSVSLFVSLSVSLGVLLVG